MTMAILASVGSWTVSMSAGVTGLVREIVRSRLSGGRDTLRLGAVSSGGAPWERGQNWNRVTARAKRLAANKYRNLI